jgi:hypothetical protein
MPGVAQVLTWLHIGDLHVTDADGENLADLRRIVGLANGLPDGAIDFALLPGDNADDGGPAQFGLVRDAIAPLRSPIHVLPGDHDYKPRTLQAFHQVLGARPLPYAETIQGCRCLFLDVVSAGTGGPDFQLGEDQLGWVERELDGAEGAAQPAIIFMHTYPADLRAGAEKMGGLIARRHVACVDMGHTHYNELANDGATIFMATRSTGQIEEGPAGFSIAALDGGGVSWRFKELDQAWPLVLITSPTDRRLVTGTGRAHGSTIRAKVLGDAPMLTVDCQIDDGAWSPMAPVAGQIALWQIQAPSGSTIRVRARDAAGREDVDQIEPLRPGWTAPPRFADGSDRDSVGAWPAKGLLGTQLGPNRNGRHW